jgi:ribosome-associated heat shock protein Hsp15
MDKWLWAARFYKTRSLAAEAVAGGKVEVNGMRAKPSRNVRIGDALTIRRGPYAWTVMVKALSTRRGPPTEAQLLHEETDESIRARQEVAVQLRLQGPQFGRSGRPSKKDRRTILKLTKRGW